MPPESDRNVARQRLVGGVFIAFLVALAATTAHQVTYLVSFGGGESYRGQMAASGHDGHWQPLLVTVLVAATVLAWVAIRELRRLAPRARHLPQRGLPDEAVSAYGWHVISLWARLGVSTAAIYALEENLEQVLVGLTPNGLDALATHGLLPLLVIVVVTLVVSAVFGLVRWRCHILRARMVATRGRRWRSSNRSRRAAQAVRRPTRPGSGTWASRAPPMGASAA